MWRETTTTSKMTIYKRAFCSLLMLCVGLLSCFLFQWLAVFTYRSATGPVPFCSVWTDIAGRLAILMSSYYIASMCGFLPLPQHCRSNYWFCAPFTFWRYRPWCDLVSSCLPRPSIDTIRRFHRNAMYRRGSPELPLYHQEGPELLYDGTPVVRRPRRLSSPFCIVHRGSYVRPVHAPSSSADATENSATFASFYFPQDNQIVPMAKGRSSKQDSDKSERGYSVTPVKEMSEADDFGKSERRSLDTSVEATSEAHDSDKSGNELLSKPSFAAMDEADDSDKSERESTKSSVEPMAKVDDSDKSERDSTKFSFQTMAKADDSKKSKRESTKSPVEAMAKAGDSDKSERESTKSSVEVMSEVDDLDKSERESSNPSLEVTAKADDSEKSEKKSSKPLVEVMSKPDDSEKLDSEMIRGLPIAAKKIVIRNMVLGPETQMYLIDESEAQIAARLKRCMPADALESQIVQRERKDRATLDRNAKSETGARSNEDAGSTINLSNQEAPPAKKSKLETVAEERAETVAVCRAAGNSKFDTNITEIQKPPPQTVKLPSGLLGAFPVARRAKRLLLRGLSKRL